MTQEALKLAEDYAHLRAIWYVESLYGTSASHTELREKVMLGAHQALKKALAQPVQEPVAWQFMNGSHFRKRRPDDFADLDSDGLPYWKPLYTTPPQRTEQEPVIGKWSLREVYFDEDGEPISHRSPPQRTEPVAKYSDIVSDGGLDPRNTTPPQRTWVGLTDKDWKEIEDMPDTFDQGVAWAQAKLKEKNT